MRHELQARHPEAAKKVKFYIGDVRNPQSIKDAMPGVDYIFHAAALKQVPSCEFFPMQAVQTNIIGTDNVLHAAIDAGVKRVVCLSTDKAAYPINAMGISKAMMEHVIYANARVAAERGGTTICCTRYGNVMWLCLLSSMAIRVICLFRSLMLLPLVIWQRLFSSCLVIQVQILSVLATVRSCSRH